MIFETSSAAHYKNILREYPQWSGIGVDKTVDKYVRLDMNYTLPNILILLTLMYSLVHVQCNETFSATTN